MYEAVPDPVTLLPDPASAAEMPVAEPLSVAVNALPWQPQDGPTLAEVAPPEVELDELFVPVEEPVAKADAEAMANTSARSFFMFISFQD